MAAACDPQFAKKLCVAEHAVSKKCAKFPETYSDYWIASQLDALFHQAPEMVQLGFCELDQIRVAKDWGEQIHPGFASNNRITISREFLFGLSVMRADKAWRPVVYFYPGYTTAKHRLFVDSDSIEKQLTVSSKSGYTPRYEFAHFMIHELAHIIEQNWPINGHALSGYFACEYASQILNGPPPNGIGYTSIFPNQFGSEADSSVYLALAKSTMATLYAASWPTEDFAELFSDYVLLEHFGINYTIEKNDEILFDRAKQFENANIQNKLEIVKKVLQWPQMSDAERQAFADDRKHCHGIFEPGASQN